MARKTYQHTFNYTKGLRTALYEGFVAAAKKRGLTLSEYAAVLFEEDWKAALGLLVKTLPKEVEVDGKVDHEHTHKHIGLSQTAAFLEAAIGGGEVGTSEELSEDRPLLPAPLPAKPARH